MYETTIKNTIRFLETLRDSKTGKAPNNILGKINNIVELYKDRRIVQKTTEEHLINSISTNNTKERAKGLKEYDKKIEQYEQSQPAG